MRPVAARILMLNQNFFLTQQKLATLQIEAD
jgi:hypothetical protein